MTKLEQLKSSLENALGEQSSTLELRLDEITVELGPQYYLDAMRILRDDPRLKFEQLIDLCGVDYLSYKNETWEGPRFAVVSHLLSVTQNWRVRVRVFAPDNDFPVVPSVTEVWSSANWYEREAFDLYGILFEGHTDLRRLLTDYGFIGHPFRKDYPLSGTVEMRYDPEQKRVIYQPVTIEPRQVVPRVVREDAYGRGR